MRIPVLALALSAFAASAAFTPATSASARPLVAAEYTFRDELVNARGFKSLADLRGKPIVIDFWGKN